MTSATSRRVAKLEGALQPREAVLAWLAEARSFPSNGTGRVVGRGGDFVREIHG